MDDSFEAVADANDAREAAGGKLVLMGGEKADGDSETISDDFLADGLQLDTRLTLDRIVSFFSIGALHYRAAAPTQHQDAI